ncbi:unnamed protein product, partial [Laminaria digitata]
MKQGSMICPRCERFAQNSVIPCDVALHLCLQDRGLALVSPGAHPLPVATQIRAGKKNSCQQQEAGAVGFHFMRVAFEKEKNTVCGDFLGGACSLNPLAHRPHPTTH